MANFQEPKDTRKPLSKFQQLVKAKALDAAQHGQSEMMQELLALEFRYQRDDTPGVSGHVKQMIDVIRASQESGGTVADLLKIEPLIQEMARLARREDASLSQKEKTRVEDAARALSAFIRKHTTFGARRLAKIASVAGNVVRRGRTKLQENFAQSGSAVFRGMARLLAPKEQSGADTEGRIKEARAEAYQNISNRNESFLNRGDSGGFDEEDYSPRRRSGSPDYAPSGNVGGDTSVFTSMLTELQAIRQLLRAQVEDDILDEEQAMRNADNGLKPVSQTARVKEKSDKPRSAIGNVLSNLAAALPRVLSTALSALGPVATTAVTAAKTALTAGVKSIGAALTTSTGLFATGAAAGAAVFLGAAEYLAGLKPHENVGKVINDLPNHDNFNVNKSAAAAAQRRLGISQEAWDAMSPARRDYEVSQLPLGYREGYKPETKSSGDISLPSSAPTPATPTMTTETGVSASQNIVPLAAPKVTSQMTTPIPQPVSQSPARRPATTTSTPVQVVSSPKRGRFEISQAGMKFLQMKEGFRAKAYRDQAGIWTIGYGTTQINGQPVREGMTITREQALELKRQHLNADLRTVEKLVKVPLNQSQVDAVASFVYNVGREGFAQSTLLKTLNSGGQITEDMFTRWNKVTDPNTGKKVVSDGLTARRQAEYAMFATPAPNSVRASGPLAVASAEHARGNVIAPVVTVVTQNGGGAGSTPVIPIPIRTTNPEPTLNALRGTGLT